MSRFALPLTLACLIAAVAVARGDEPIAVPVESKPGDEAPATPQPTSASPGVIVIETTPDIQRSAVIGKLVESLEKDGIAKRSDEKREGKPVDFHASIYVRPNMPGEKIRALIETLTALSIGHASIHVGPADGESAVFVTCPADVTFPGIRTLYETLERQNDFKVDLRVAANNQPVTLTGPPMFKLTPPNDSTTLGKWEVSTLPPVAIDDASAEVHPEPQENGGLGNDFGFGAMGLPASAIPGRNWLPGTKVIVTFSDDGKQVLAYSEQHPRWVAQDLEQVADIKPLPVVGSGDTVAVRVGHLFYAYSPTLGKWDVLKLPPGEVAVPMVSDDGVNIHSPSQGDYVFKNSWGKWFSTDEIKAGRVAEYLLAQRDAAPAGPAEVETTEKITVFHLTYIQATEALRIVQQLYGLSVKRVAVDDRTNSLIVVSDNPVAFTKVRELLQAIDSPTAKDLALPQQAQTVDDLRKLYKELEQRTKELAAQLRDPAENPAATKQLHEELRVTVRKAFEARQNLQRAELADFTQRLQAIQQSIEMRDRISQQIIDRRVEELLDPTLKWDSAKPHELLRPNVRHSSPSSPISVPPLPGEVVCWELFGAKFREVDEIAGVQYPGGLQIVELSPTGPAAKAGLQVGDIVVQIDRRGAARLRQVSYVLHAWQESSDEVPVPVTFVRGKEIRHAHVKLAEIQPTSPPVGDLEKLLSESIGSRKATPLDDAIKVFNEKYADNPFCKVQPELSPFEVTGAIRIALDREKSVDLSASDLKQLRSIADERIVPGGWQFEIYTDTHRATGETFLQRSIGLTLIRPDGTVYTHEIRRLLNEPTDGTEDGGNHVLGVYNVGRLPLWTQDGKKQHAGLLIRYLKAHVDPSSWENGTTIAVHDAAALSLVVHASRKNQNEIARTLESIVPIKMAMDDRLDMIRYPIGDLPLWSQDGKGQNIPLLGDYLQSVDPRPAWGPADDGHSLAISETDEEGRKKIADAINVLRVEMLLEHLAALVRARDYAGYVDLLTDDEVVRLARFMSKTAAVPEDHRQFVIDMLIASEAPPGTETSPNWNVVVEGDHAIATESTDEQAPTRIALTRVNGQWKISNLFGRDTIKGIVSGASQPSETPGIRVSLLLDAESYSQKIMQQIVGFEGFSILASGVQGVEDQTENSTVATRCRLESFEEADAGERKYWRTTIFVPQGSTVYESNLSLTQEKLDEMQERGVEFKIFPLRHHVESGLAGIVTEPVWGETENGLQLGISGIREQQHFATETTVRFNLLVRNAGSEPIRIQYSISKTGYWIAPTIVTEAGEQVRFNAMAFRGGHKTYIKTLEPEAMVGVEAPGIVVLGESKTANQYWPKTPNPQPGEYKLHAGFLFTRVDAEDKPLGKYFTLTSGSVNFHIDGPKAVGADVTSGRANGQKLPDSPGTDVKSD